MWLKCNCKAYSDFSVFYVLPSIRTAEFLLPTPRDPKIPRRKFENSLLKLILKTNMISIEKHTAMQLALVLDGRFFNFKTGNFNNNNDGANFELRGEDSPKSSEKKCSIMLFIN